MVDFTQNTEDAFVSEAWGASLDDIAERVPAGTPANQQGSHFTAHPPEEIKAPAPPNPEIVPPTQIEKKEVDLPEENSEQNVEDSKDEEHQEIEIKEKSDSEKEIARLAYESKESKKRERAALVQLEMLRTQNPNGFDQQQMAVALQQAEVVAEYKFGLRELDKKVADDLGSEYSKVTTEFNNLTGGDQRFQSVILESLFDVDNAPLVVKHLSESPLEVQRLYGLAATSPHLIGRELIKMAMRMAPVKETPKQKQMSKMPPPITAIGGSNSPTTAPNPDSMSMDDYVAWRNSQPRKLSR